jgi:hypothetical protein
MLSVMKNSLHVIGISIVCLCGFYSVSAKAASINSMDTGFHSILNKNVAVYLDIDGYHDITNPAISIAVNEANDMDGFSSFGLPKFKESVSTGAHIDTDAKLNDHGGETSSDGINYQDLALSAETDDAIDMAEISSFGLPDLDERDTNVELLETTENATPASSAVNNTSQSVFVNETNTPSTEIVSFEEAANRGNKFAENSSNDENGVFVPELDIYAMLLVFLGLMAFTARRRRDII